MKFKKYMNENENELENAIASIKKDCQPFLKECKIPIYRGIYFAEKTLIEKTPRQDRRPKDMPEYLHKILDSLFNEHFGWKPRSNGVFCSPHFCQAESYGNTYLFFPIGNFDYLYSDNIEDLYVDIRDGHNIPFPSMDDKSLEHLFDLLMEDDFDNMGIRRWLNKYSDCSIWLGRADFINKLQKDTPDDFREFKKYIYKYNNKAVDELENLVKTFNNGGLSRIKANTYTEIAFKCDRYYALSILTAVNVFNTVRTNAVSKLMDMIYEI